MKSKFYLLTISVMSLMLISCNVGNGKSSSSLDVSSSEVISSVEPITTSEEPFKFNYWSEGSEVLAKLVNYVEDVTNKDSENYIPVEDRIATFDMDGTFYGELFPTYLEYWFLKYRGLEDPTYEAPGDVREAAQNIKDFYENKIPSLPSGFELIHANMQAKAFAGMTVKDFDSYVKNFLKFNVEGFENLTFGNAFYKPMLEVFDYLEENDFTYYVVSGSDRYICKALVCDSLGIPTNRVIGMDVELRGSKQDSSVENVNYTFTKDEDLIRGDKMMIKDLKMNKVMNIYQEIGKKPVLSFGNSSGDQAMHNYCLSNENYKTEVFMLIADDYDEDHANPTETNDRKAKWIENKYNIISMHDDFTTIYGEDVIKTKFSWEE